MYLSNRKKKGNNYSYLLHLLVQQIPYSFMYLVVLWVYYSTPSPIAFANVSPAQQHL